MRPFSRKSGYVESTVGRLAYGPVMAVLVTGVVVLWWPLMAWNDYRLRRVWRKHWGKGQGRVVIPYEPGTPWHDAIIASWIPRYGDRTSLVDLTTLKPKSRSLEDRVYRRWHPRKSALARPPFIIGIPAKGRVVTVSFADVIENPVRLDRQFQDVARITFDE